MLTLREKHEYEQEIADLKARLIKAQSLTSYFKVKYEKLNGSTPKTTDTRMVKARALIKAKLDGGESLSYKQIAKQCFVECGTIYNAVSKMRKDRLGRII
jgi:hypothetical protein